MNCYNHNEISAVAQCKDCGKGLCNDCSKQFAFPICSACNVVRMGNEKKHIWKELFVTFGAGSILTFIIWQATFRTIDFSADLAKNIGIVILMFYMYSGVVSGWKALSKITPQVFLFLPLIGWVIYFAVKGFISIWLGMVVLPIRTFKNFKRIAELNSITV